MIAFHGVHRTYPNGPALHFPDFEIHAGERIHLRGPSGCGKTTALHLIAGLLRPDGGRIQLLGHDLEALRLRALDRLRGRHVGLVFQRHHLLQALSVLDNLLLAAELAGQPRNREHALALLDAVDLRDRARVRPAALSGGEAQRAALARAVIHEPAVVLADEPTAGLDAQRCEDTLALLDRLCTRTGATLLIASHDDRVATLASRTLTLESPA